MKNDNIWFCCAAFQTTDKIYSHPFGVTASNYFEALGKAQEICQKYAECYKKKGMLTYDHRAFVNKSGFSGLIENADKITFTEG